jgi:hypothetical protein
VDWFSGVHTQNVAWELLVAVMAIALMPASWACLQNCSPSRFRAVIIIEILLLLNSKGMRKHNVFPEPVGAMLIMSCQMECP